MNDMITTSFRRRALVLASMMLAVAFSLPGLMFAGSAGAAPLAAKGALVQSAQDSDVTLVRDGCGRGMRFSNRLQACVEAFDGPPAYVAPGCPPGTRFSERMQACIEMRQVDPGAAIVNGVINGLVGGGGCPPGTRWSNGRGRCVYD